MIYNTNKMYQITKKQCQSDIDKRMPIICTSCGGKIEPIETVDNANQPTFWSGCKKCMKFDNGTIPKIYEISVKMVDEKHFWAYHFDSMPDKEKEPEKFDYWRKSQISGTVDVVIDVLELSSLYESQPKL